MENNPKEQELPLEFQVISPYLIVANVEKCAGCGLDHDGMHFYQTHGEYSAKCPAGNRKVYLKVKYETIN